MGTVEEGFFRSKMQMRKSIFYLPRSGKVKDNLLRGAGYGKIKPVLGRQRKAKTLIPRGGISKRVSPSRMTSELIKELEYQIAVNKERKIKLEKLLNYPSGKGVKYPGDYLLHVGIWRKNRKQEIGHYEKNFKNERDHYLLPYYRPTMCYGDSGGPTYVVKKNKKGRKLNLLLGVNSIMDDYCQQFMIASSTSANKRWILSNMQNKDDKKWLIKSLRKRKKKSP